MTLSTAVAASLSALALLTASTPAPVDAQMRRGAPSLEARPLDAPVTVPLRIVENRPVVDVFVDGQGPVPMIVDTGAMAALVSGALVEELALPVVGRAMVGDPSGGVPLDASVHQAGEVTVGSARFPTVRMIVAAGPDFFERIGAPGVLSILPMAGNVVVFDFPARELRIVPGALVEGDGSLPWAGDARPIASTEIDVAGRTVAADLDTGNGRGFMLPARLRDSLVLSGPLQADTAHLVTGPFEVWRGRLEGTVRIGGITLQNPEVTFQDRFPQANVGTASLAHAVLMVDPLNRRWWVGTDGAPRPGDR